MGNKEVSTIAPEEKEGEKIERNLLNLSCFPRRAVGEQELFEFLLLRSIGRC